MSTNNRINAFCAILLCLLNAFIIRPLFSTEYLPHLFSIEGAYIALTRWAMANAGDLSWFPLWNSGEPFQSTYQPGLPILCALTGRILHIDAALAYHITIGLLYCLGPVGIFFLAYYLSKRRDVAVLAALVFSLLSPSAFLVPVIRHDLGNVLYARRYQDMVFYGEGPNVCGLSLVPFGMLAVHAVYQRFTAIRVLAGSVILGLIVLVSWPASVVLAMGTLAYLLAQDWPEARRRFPRVLCLTVTSYLLIAPLDLPSTILANQRNSQQISGDYRYTPLHLLYFALVVAALGVSRFLFRRLRVERFAEFSFYWFLIPGVVALAAFWFKVSLLPQPERFHLGMEIGLALLGSWTVVRVFRTQRAVWIAGTAVLCILVPVQARVYQRYAGKLTRSFDITKSYEFQVSRWLESHMAGERVFASGSAAFWMNVWSDQPQATGCCAPGLPNPMSWIFSYTVPHDYGPGNMHGDNALLWMRAFGVRAVVVGGPNSRDSYHDWTHPEAFAGVLPEMWHDDDDAIYRVPSRTGSLAHVIRADEVVARAPINGLDSDPLRAFVNALEDPARPIAAWQWVNHHEAQIDADLRTGDLVSVQETWLPGWHAEIARRKIDVTRDAIGLMVLHPNGAGPTRIKLFFDGGLQAMVFKALSVMCWIALIGWAVFRRVADQLVARA